MQYTGTRVIRYSTAKLHKKCLIELNTYKTQKFNGIANQGFRVDEGLALKLELGLVCKISAF